jgi:hypothetical protein
MVHAQRSVLSTLMPISSDVDWACDESPEAVLYLDQAEICGGRGVA